jgi:hypothetical protein
LSSQDPDAGRGDGELTSIEHARRRAMLSAFELWLGYFGLGGEATFDHFKRCLSGRAAFDRLQHNIAVQALNDHYVGLGGDHPVPYAEN